MYIYMYIYIYIYQTLKLKKWANIGKQTQKELPFPRHPFFKFTGPALPRLDETQIVALIPCEEQQDQGLGEPQ